MALIDGSAVTVASPRSRADFGAELASVQWVLNGHVLALSPLTLIGSALTDVYGKARMLALGCILFGLPSTDAGVAFLRISLRVGLLSRVFGSLAEGWRAGHAYRGAGGRGARLYLNGIRRESFLDARRHRAHTLLGLSFAVHVAPLTASSERLKNGLERAAQSRRSAFDAQCRACSVARGQT
jgi:MFS family permease